MFLLIIGAISDYNTRQVTNRLTYSVALLCVPLILSNIYKHELGIPQVAFVIVIIISYFAFLHTKQPLGGADVKLMVPLALSMPMINFIFFLLIMSMMITLLLLKFNPAPGVVGITTGYILSLLV